MKRQRKSYEKPLKPWDKERLEQERKILQEYGLKNKMELLRGESILRKFRQRARDLAAQKDKDKEKVLLEKLHKMGLLTQDAALDNVLTLTVENLLERRLQTIVLRKGFAQTAKQARQFITHGHIIVDGRKAKSPGMVVTIHDEPKIAFREKSTVKDWVIKVKNNG